MRRTLSVLIIGLVAGCGRTDLSGCVSRSDAAGAADDVPDTTSDLSQSWLAFQLVNRDDSFEIHAVDISGRQPDRILSTEPFGITRTNYFELDAPVNQGAFRWSPDGSMLVYFGVPKITDSSPWWSPQFLVDFDNFSNPPAVEVVIEDNMSGGFSDAHWTADSRYLWFNRGQPSEMCPDIYLADLTDRVVRPGKLIFGAANCDRVKWSPDGYRFAYEHGLAWGTAPDDELMFVSAIDGQGTAPRRLYPPFPKWGHVYCWEWSPDGNWMTYVRPSDENSCGLYVVSVQGDQIGEPLQLSPDRNSECSCAFWSPDSRRLVFTMTKPPSNQTEFFQADFDDTATPVVSRVLSTLADGFTLGSEPLWLDPSRVIMSMESSDETETRVHLIDFREQSPVASALNVPQACAGTFLNNGSDSIGYLHWACSSRCGNNDTTTVLELKWVDVTGNDAPRSLGLYRSCFEAVATSADRSLYAMVARATAADQGLRDLYYIRVDAGTIPEAVRMENTRLDLKVSPKIRTLAWSPNGEAIAFVDDDSVLYWVAARQSARTHRLTTPSTGTVGYAWRPAGTQ